MTRTTEIERRIRVAAQWKVLRNERDDVVKNGTEAILRVRDAVRSFGRKKSRKTVYNLNTFLYVCVCKIIPRARTAVFVVDS